MSHQNLARAALKARENAYAPYSHFKVGAALLAKNGKIYTGCNIENAAYSPTLCAERTAVAKAVSDGVREFSAIAIAGAQADGEPQFCYPCGVCRQVLKEFLSDDCEILIVKSADEYKLHKFGEMLPHGFGPENLGHTVM
ncbi:MAG: cytidine deaminase [Defluviitaleaceae bacterium]|nr:cytidine deaminase [Defluviitaleaceae bacterium]